MASCLILFSLLALSQAYPEGTRHEFVQSTTNGTISVNHTIYAPGSVYVRLNVSDDLKDYNLVIAVGKYPTCEEEKSEKCMERLTFLLTNITTQPVNLHSDSQLKCTKPDGEATKPDGEVTKPDGEATKPDGEATKPDGEVTKPDGEVTKPDGEVTKPDGEVTKPDGRRKRDDKQNEDKQNNDKSLSDSFVAPTSDVSTWDDDETQAIMTLPDDGWYVVAIHFETVGAKMVEPKDVKLQIDVTLRSWYGYLDGADYPAMIFYGLMMLLYLILTAIWSACLCCYWKDLLRLQYFILAALVIAFVEKLFFLAEYAHVNVTAQNSQGGFAVYLVVAEGISAFKGTLCRILIIVIASGFGTVRPRLGGLLPKILLFGAVFFVAAWADGGLRATQYVTRFQMSQWVLIASIPQLLLDMVTVYWTISAVLDTRRQLVLGKNLNKLTLYNHLLIVLVLLAIAVVGFEVWYFCSSVLAKCEDWKSNWLRKCYWHILFSILLVVIMILWRPTSNALGYAYSKVPGEDQEDADQTANENFETIKLKQQKKSPVELPKPSFETEEDLRGVKENLPASAIENDKGFR